MVDDRNSPATKGDLTDLRIELKSELANQKDELIEAIRDSQTEVLKAFYGFFAHRSGPFQGKMMTARRRSSAA